VIVIEDLSKSFEEINNKINEFSEYNGLFQELEENALFDPGIPAHIKNKDFLQSRLLVSEIIEKKEIVERFNNLVLNIGSLKEAMVKDEDEKISKRINLILNNEYSSIKTIISELNSLKSKIDEFEKVHTSLLDSNLISLDIKIVLEQELLEKQKLDDFYNKQKETLLGLSKIFVRLAKNSMLNK